MDRLLKYFPGLSKEKASKLKLLTEEILQWNNKINVISRKDTENIEIRHILHSLAIAKFFNFNSKDVICDVGTGAGLPGLPLAIMFPQSKFILVDSIRKKIKVVDEISQSLDLKNVYTSHSRIEKSNIKANYIVSRAVTAFPDFYNLTKKIIDKKKDKSGIIYLKGGDFTSEITKFKSKIKIYKLSDIYKEEFFETKKIIFLKI